MAQHKSYPKGSSKKSKDGKAAGKPSVNKKIGTTYVKTKKSK